MINCNKKAFYCTFFEGLNFGFMHFKLRVNLKEDGLSYSISYAIFYLNII